MLVLKELQDRSNNTCELCAATENLKMYLVPPKTEEIADHAILACETCISQIEDPEKIDPNHWRSLNDSMWSQYTPVKVVAWRMLNQLKGEGWPVDLLGMMYMEPEELEFAKAAGDFADDEDKVIHRDCNGVILAPGDSVVLIKDLKVKGSSMVAKQGTAVRRISLDPENANFIEGKVEGQTIVIITEYVKKI